MKKHLGSLIFIFLFVLAAVFSYFYLPPAVKLLHQKINQSDPLSSDEARLSLVREYDNFLADGLPERNPALYFYWFSNQRKMSDLRIKKAIEEIKDMAVAKNEMRVWSLLNMGAVIKTEKQTIAIDTANLPLSWAHNGLADIVDIFIVSHMDGDHYDPALLKKALGKNKKIFFLKGFIFADDNPNVYKLASGETKEIGGVKITAYQTDHRGDGNFEEPSAWFIVEVDGFKLFHTGDGRDFKNKEEAERVYAMKDFDILLGNCNTGTTLHPYNIRDIKPQVLLPLHLFKFMHAGEFYRESTIEAVASVYEKYSQDLQGIEKVYLLPGESFIYGL